MALRIRLLGGVELDRDGERQPLDSARAETLLAYLLLHRDVPQSRRHLAFLLWPDTTEAQARTNLRHLLHHLRHSLPDADRYLDTTARTVQWRPDLPWELDVADFDSALRRAAADPDSGIDLLRAAVELYRGELVPGGYDEWLLEARDDHRRRYLDALRRLVSQLVARNEAAQALSFAERLVSADPLDEHTYRVLMRLYDEAGDRARALRVYHGCVATLERELGVAPSAATRQAYDALLARDDDQVDAETPGAAPFVGRTAEREQLAARWAAAQAGRPGMVLLTGEAGIGKSRLADDFRAWCAQRGASTAEARSYAAEGELAYGPVLAWLRSAGVRAGLSLLDRRHLTDLARLLPELLVEMPGLPPPEPLPDGELRPRMWDALTRALRTSRRPLLLIADDLQWADRETLQYLHYLLRTAADTPLLLVATVRSEEDGGPGSALGELVRGARVLDRLTDFELRRLDAAETAVLAERLTGTALPGRDAERLWRDTEGNPLFVVEALRAGWPATGAVSPKVQAVLEEHLGRLSRPALELVGTAATIGRDFSIDLLQTVAAIDDDTLVRCLDELWRRRIVRERGGSAYDFSHDKIRAVAYAGLSPALRRQYHLRIARALDASATGGAGHISARIAAHYEQAGMPAEAAARYLEAATAAQRLHANTDAVRLLDRASGLLRTLPPSPDRDHRELQILTALPAPLVSVEGYASRRLSLAHERAVQLAAATGTELGAPLLWSLAFTSLVGEDYARAVRFAGELRDRGEATADEVLVVQGSCLLGLAAFWQNDLPRAQESLAEAVHRFRPEQRSIHLVRFAQDPEVVALARLGNIHWLLGDRAAAEGARDRALARAAEGGQPLTQGAAVVFAAVLALDMDDHERIRNYAATLSGSSTPPPQIAYFTAALAGFVDVLDGRRAAGLTRIRAAVDDAGPHPAAPGMRAILLRVQLAAGVAADDPAAVVDAAERLLALGGPARVWEAEARRRRSAFTARIAKRTGNAAGTPTGQP